MDHTVAALVEFYIANYSIVVCVFGELIVQRGPVAQVAPPKVGRMGVDKAFAGGGFHHGKVDGDLFALGEDGFHFGLWLLAIGLCTLASWNHLIHLLGYHWLVLGDARCDGLNIPHEDAGIPEEVACSEVLFGSGKVGFFLEGTHATNLTFDGFFGLHVAIARFGTGGLNTNSYNGIVFVGIVQGIAYHPTELLGIHHHGIGRGHHHIGRGVILTDAPAGSGDAGCRVAGSGLGQDMVGRNVGQLLTDNLDVGGIGHHPEVPHRADALEAVDGELNQRPPATQDVYELLRVLGRAQRPESAAYTPRHDYYVVVSHYMLLNCFLSYMLKCFRLQIAAHQGSTQDYRRITAEVFVTQNFFVT